MKASIRSSLKVLLIALMAGVHFSVAHTAASHPIFRDAFTANPAPLMYKLEKPSQHPKGMYLIKISQDDKSSVIKLIKEQ